jgi:hypothetical protein
MTRVASRELDGSLDRNHIAAGSRMYHPLQGVGRSRGAPGHARHARLGALCYSRAPRPPRSSPRRSSSTRSGPTITTTSGGLAYRGDGKLEQAIASFEKALAIYPRHAWSYAQWGATLADIDHRDKGAVAEDTVRIVAQKLDRALELRPDDPNLLSLLRTFGQAYWLQEWSAQPHDADHPAGEI